MNILEAVSTVFTVIGTGRYRRTVEHDSLVIDTQRNSFYWNSRGFGGGVFTFLTKVANIDAKVASILSSPVEEYVIEEKELRQDLHLLFWQFGKSKRDFWYSRGFNDAVIDLYTLGYYAGQYTLPFVVNKKLNAIIFRNDKKFISEIRGSKKSLFGYDQLERKEILLVESPMDVPLLRMFGYDAISFTYGANAWDTDWNSLLTDYNITIIPDNDSAGKYLIKRITLPAKVSRWPKATPYKFDIGKLYLNNKDKFVSNVDFLINNAIPIECHG